MLFQNAVGGQRAEVRAEARHHCVFEPDRVLHDVEVGDPVDVGRGVEGGVEDEVVVAGAAGQRVVAGSAVEKIVAAEAVERVIAAGAAE